MLELAKITADIDDLARERAESNEKLREQIRQAASTMSRITENLAAARRKIEIAQTSWLPALFDESPQTTHERPMLPASYAVSAVDGSQIASDKHEASTCYLLNAASVIIYYGKQIPPEYRTRPTLCFRDEDLYEESNGERQPVAGASLSLRRTLSECEEMRYAIGQSYDKAGDSTVVALWDGSLIWWWLKNGDGTLTPPELQPFLDALTEARERTVPVAGYISDPGSKDFVRSLQIMNCYEPEQVNCGKCSYQDQPLDERPCGVVNRLTDGIVFKALGDGERSTVFTSGSKILKHYGEHAIRAFYLNTGKEIARIEVPQWVAEHPYLLDRVHAVCYDQAQKGRGYPVVLDQAHEKAVLQGADRRTFFEVVERALIKHGVPITRSLKRISKGY